MNKDFQNFIDSLDHAKCKEIIGKSEIQKVDFTHECMQEYTNKILSKSLEMSINLLELYHDWLNSEETHQ